MKFDDENENENDIINNFFFLYLIYINYMLIFKLYLQKRIIFSKKTIINICFKFIQFIFRLYSNIITKKSNVKKNAKH